MEHARHSITANSTIETHQFWMSSLEKSWQGGKLNTDQDLSRLDWLWLLTIGAYHRILADLHYTWSNLKCLPEFVQEALWMSQQRARYRGTRIIQGIGDLQQIATSKNIRMALLKSPTYIVQAFNGYERREVHDIDMLAFGTDMPVITQGLLELGYETEQRTRQHKGGECLFFKKDLLIEVHKVASNRRRFQRLLSTEDLLQRAIITEHYSPLLKLSDSDEALIMVLHAYHHGWREALWIRDLAAWWRIRNPNPNEVLETFKAVDLLRTGWMAWIGMSIIGWSLPEAWTLQNWCAHPAFDRQARMFWHQCLGRIGQSRELFLRRRYLEVILAQSWQSKLSALAPIFSWRSLSEFCRIQSRN